VPRFINSLIVAFGYEPCLPSPLGTLVGLWASRDFRVAFERRSAFLHPLDQNDAAQSRSPNSRSDLIVPRYIGCRDTRALA